MKLFAIILSLLGCASLLPLRAHHGRDFILVQDATISGALSGVVTSGFEWSSMAGDDEFSSESGLFLGLAPFLAVGANVSFMDSGMGWSYNSVTPNIVFALLRDQPFKLAFWLGYQVARPEAGHDHGGHAHVHDDEDAPCGPDYGPDAPPCDEVMGGGGHVHMHGADGGHMHSGIHQHGASGMFSRMIFDLSLGSGDKLVINLVSFAAENGKPGWGYAAGFRHEFHHDLSASIEALGDFAGDGYHVVVLAGQFGVFEHVSIRLALGAGLTEASPDFIVNAGMLWRF